MRTLIEYPKLPVLPLDKCFAVFKIAGIPNSKLKDVSGFTRMCIWKWKNNKAEALPHSLDRVSVLAYKTLRAIRNEKAPFPAGVTPDYMLSCLNDDSGKPLRDYAPEELLPRNWIAQFTPEV